MLINSFLRARLNHLNKVIHASKPITKIVNHAHKISGFFRSKHIADPGKYMAHLLQIKHAIATFIKCAECRAYVTLSLNSPVYLCQYV